MKIVTENGCVQRAVATVDWEIQGFREWMKIVTETGCFQQVIAVFGWETWMFREPWKRV